MSIRETIDGIIQRAQDAFTGNDSGNAPVMLMLGGFKFSLNTAVFQTMQRATSYRWPSQERMGQYDAKQFTGPGDDSITLPGIVFPEFRGGAWQIEDLRSLASEGRPLQLISSAGYILGVWVIDRIEETQAEFNPDGSFRKQEFTVNISRFGNDNADI